MPEKLDGQIDRFACMYTHVLDHLIDSFIIMQLRCIFYVNLCLWFY